MGTTDFPGAPLAPGEDSLAGIATQAAFNAAWDLLTLWKGNERICAADFGQRLGDDICALPEVRYALASAELRARSEAGEPMEGADERWGALSGASGASSRLVRYLSGLLRRNSVKPPGTGERYPFLKRRNENGLLGELGRFRVLREVGRGGMGTVFELKIENPLLPDPRALKILETREREALQRFCQEIEVLKALQHPNIVRLYDADEVEGVAYILMDYVYGPTLEELIDYHLGAPVPLPLAADLIRQTALGLVAVHSQKVCHRDIKPSNILLQWVIEAPDDYLHGWRARICDFGLARAPGQVGLTRPGERPGTPLYWSPEQVKPALGPVGPPSDVFSLGLVAFELLTGRHPFREGDGVDDPLTLAVKIAECRVPSPRSVNRHIPPGLEQLILRMLKRNPGERPSARQVASELDDLCSREEVSPSDESGPNASSGPLATIAPDTDELQGSVPVDRRLGWSILAGLVALGTGIVTMQQLTLPNMRESSDASKQKHQPGESQMSGEKPSSPPKQEPNPSDPKQALQTDGSQKAGEEPPPPPKGEQKPPNDQGKKSKSKELRAKVIDLAQGFDKKADGSFKDSDLLPQMKQGTTCVRLEVDEASGMCRIRLDNPRGFEIWVEIDKIKVIKE